jgi:lipid II:glycine glycyltransferase (peptidoglycan interpeptide bridge formation enzyme)
MRVFLCKKENQPIAALVGSHLGNRGIYLLGATGDQGMKLKGAYLLQWRMIEWLKERGASNYDLGGYSPAKNPGTAQFKAGLSGQEVHGIGQFVAHKNFWSAALHASAMQAKTTTHKVREVLQRARN